MQDQDECDSTTWVFSGLRQNTAAEELVKLGQIGEQARTKSDRLSVTKNCSLVIKKVSAEDAGRYTCRQYKSGHQQGPDSQVHLSVVTMTEREDADEVTLSCSVVTCSHTIEWLRVLHGAQQTHSQDVKTSQFHCSATVTFLQLELKSNYRESFKCKLKNVHSGEVQLFAFSSQSSAGDPTKTPAAESTTKASQTVKSTEHEARTDCSVLDYMMLVLRVAELLLITLIAVLLIRAAGKQRPPDDNTVSHSVRRRTARRSGAAAGQVKVSSDRRWWCVQVNNDEDEDEGVVKYENFGETSASVSLH
uniref:uncharacterized protein LOC124050350 n=1 Tax=Scatophagus argus TaxID=75038 RepID=UPI001ED843E7|nr:uncharacterized protein LOC124050350 [Scatophagus argus]